MKFVDAAPNVRSFLEQSEMSMRSRTGRGWRSGKHLLAGCVALTCTLCGIDAAMGQNGFTGRITVGVEAERKTCIGCATDERENEIETTPIEIVFRRAENPNLSFGLELEHDVESEGDFFGAGREDVEINNSINFWARRDFNDTYWARLQGEYQSEEKSLDLGGRVGFSYELSDTRELTGYFNVDRRFSLGSGSTAHKGTFVEARLEHEWDWDERGAWIAVRGERWFFDSAGAEDEARVTLEPGIWFELGDSPHRGLLWLETEDRRRKGPDNFKRRTNSIGVGAELDLGDGRELMVGAIYGRERTTEAGNPTERKKITGLILEYQTRF